MYFEPLREFELLYIAEAKCTLSSGNKTKNPANPLFKRACGIYFCLEQMKDSEGVTEGMKQHDQMAWVGAMNSIRNRAEEIILRELIYEEDAV